MLRVENLSIRRGGKTVLEGLELELRPGEMLGVLGPNGAGKSTLLGALCGELEPAEGLVLLDERKEADLPGIAEQIGESRLSFASVERLREYLGVELGCVTPFALVNDPQHRVEVLLDDAIRQDQLLGFHPLVNTATECIRYADLLAFLAHTGHEPRLIRV